MVLKTGYPFFKSVYSFLPDETTQRPCGTRYDYKHENEINRVTHKERPSFMKIDHL